MTPILHVEVRQHVDSVIEPCALEEAMRTYLQTVESVPCCTPLRGWQTDPFLAEHVDHVYVDECDPPCSNASVPQVQIALHVYQPCPMDNVDEFGVGDPHEGTSDNSVAATLSELPSRALDGVWPSLIYGDDVKWRLLHYIHSTMLFSDADVDFTIISWNRVVLLHGPPGTGKTSLCRALAQKLAIRLHERYTHGKLVEINSHSLFSKWFSESGKLVHRLFDMVAELVEDESGFVVVLIDEIESLSKARSSAAAGVEPSDSIRVVNALLTELDKLKHKRNVLVMTTSNLSDSIDPAFLDRADIRQYIGLPGEEAVYGILRSCMLELIRAGLALETPLPSYRELDMEAAAMTEQGTAQALRALAAHCHGASGRSLRRLPVLAHARYLRRAGAVPCIEWIQAMRHAWDDSATEAVLS
ncbi:thyroid receptor-interacting protein 13 [Malassezia pachydermatis]|uniref:Thyroid receptor-interacting protein 13 n=1 Tax=Malassezia pachydermatis TaxID=77020 RepID=A0A0M8MWM2_9BASI|nr:thyroid receptor-interacting protein 13 [Malassezia pachydermatis]KOS15260.1 thyroid receptor-interacting protein 13 [Malassezia pachydermatis]